MAGLGDIQKPNPGQEAASQATQIYLDWKTKAGADTPFNPTPLIAFREGGDRADVYLDSLKKPTAGIGHLLTKEEQKRYPKGSIIPEETRKKWFAEDSDKAVNAALLQAKELGISDPRFMETLASVNFQLGTNWNKEHKRTWALMKEGKYREAAKEAEDSKWFNQTKERVRDLQQALMSLTK